MKYLIKIVIVFFMLSGCGRDFENPVDSIVYLGTAGPFSLSQYQDGIMIKFSDESRFPDGYQIERKSNMNPYVIVSSSTGQGTETYLDTAIVTGIQYEYRVCGVADENKSAYAGPESFRAEFPAPTALRSELTSISSLQLYWTDNSTFEDGFIIERKTGPGGTWQVLGQVAANIVTFTDQGLEFNQYYDYRVKAFTGRNQSEYSLPDGRRAEIDKPTNLSAIPVNDHEIRVAWTDNSSIDEGVIIERMENDNNAWHMVGTVSANLKQFIDDSLSTNVKYTYRVRAFSGMYESWNSMYAEAATSFPQPANLSMQSISQFSARLFWGDPYNFESGFTVKYVREGFTDTVRIDLPENTEEFLIDDISRDYSYLITVYAFTNYNVSSASLAVILYSEVFDLSRTLTENEIFVKDVEFSPDGNLLAAGDELNNVALYNSSLAHYQTISGDTAEFSEAVTSLDFARYNPWLAIGNISGAVRIVNTNTLNEVRRLYLNSYPLNACAFSGDDAFIAAAQYEYIYIWNTSGWDFVKNISAHNHEILDIDFSSDGKWLASGGMDDVVKIWSASDWSSVTTINDHADDITCLSFAPNSEWLAVGSADRRVSIWSTSGWSGVHELTGFSYPIADLDFSADGSILAVITESSSQVYLFSTESWELINTLTDAELDLLSIDFDPDSFRLAAGSVDRDVYVWDSTGGWVMQ